LGMIVCVHRLASRGARESEKQRGGCE